MHTVGKTKVSQLTPKCRSLYSKSVMLNKQLRHAKRQCNSFKSRLSAAKKFDEVLNNNISSRMTTAAAILTKLQMRETHNKAKGRRFTLEEKLLSLSLFKQSAKTYRILSRLFTLPSRKTLTSLLSKIPVKTGVDNTLINVLKHKVKHLNYKQKYCVLLFDQVSLQTNLQYDDSAGTISGFEDNGTSTTQSFADHSLVFMVKGIVKKFKQPISYTFCKSTTDSNDLASQIKKVVQVVHSTGLKIVALVCDQGATNTAAINVLKNETKARCIRNTTEYRDEFIEIVCGSDLLKLVHIYDFPHLLKGIRNNLLHMILTFIINGKQMEAS